MTTNRILSYLSPLRAIAGVRSRAADCSTWPHDRAARSVTNTLRGLDTACGRIRFLARVTLSYASRKIQRQSTCNWEAYQCLSGTHCLFSLMLNQQNNKFFKGVANGREGTQHTNPLFVEKKCKMNTIWTNTGSIVTEDHPHGGFCLTLLPTFPPSPSSWNRPYNL